MSRPAGPRVQAIAIAHTAQSGAETRPAQTASQRCEVARRARVIAEADRSACKASSSDGERVESLHVQRVGQPQQTPGHGYGSIAGDERGTTGARELDRLDHLALQRNICDEASR